MAQSPIQSAIQQICQEKNLSEEAVLRTIELALAAAYRKDFGNKTQNIVTEFNPKTGGVKVFDVKTVVEDLPEEALIEGEEEIIVKDNKIVAGPAVEKATELMGEEEEEELIRRFNPKTEIQLKDAKLIDKKYKLGDEIITPLDVPGEFGRMAAQTAKQVIIQKLREEERQNIYEEYKDLENQVVVGVVQRREGRNVLVDLGRTMAIMPAEEQVEGERYHLGNRMKFYLKSVEQTTRGPQLIVSRSHPEIVKKIFELEIPEVANGLIEIKNIAREAGRRSKVAIITNDESIDPIGSCVGQRGTRIQTIIHELNNEKVDIILWDEDLVKFITNALSPAKIVSIELKKRDEEKLAIATVKDDQLSLAIGRAGQNVRLASRLTGWKIDIISASGKTATDALTDQIEVKDQPKDSDSKELVDEKSDQEDLSKPEKNKEEKETEIKEKAAKTKKKAEKAKTKKKD